jgi:hypothetical protein
VVAVAVGVAVSCTLGTGGTGGAGLAPGTGSGGAGGDGTSLPCGTPLDCPQTNPCAAYTCDDSRCQVSFAPTGTPVSGSPPGDCRRRVCSEGGTVSELADEGDPFDDGNDCTSDTCSGSTPQHTNLSDGTACGMPGAMLHCEAGVCIGCTQPGQCSYNACQDPTCVAMQCGTMPKPMGTVVLDANNADCVQEVCDGNGMTELGADPDDVPDDMLDCTLGVCQGMDPIFSVEPNGTACPTGYCYESACSECGIDSNCTMPEVCCTGVCTPGGCGGAGGAGGVGGAGGAGGAGGT